MIKLCEVVKAWCVWSCGLIQQSILGYCSANDIYKKTGICLGDIPFIQRINKQNIKLAMYKIYKVKLNNVTVSFMQCKQLFAQENETEKNNQHFKAW